jgi:DNA invertase Pin-like site-specific DNA recombinase
MRRAFSYARFSTSEQMDGRSLKRQEEAAKAYCARHGLKLDGRTFTDLGVSGHHGANATHGELGAFLELVKEGRVPKGSVLIVENIDRLSRLPPDEATAIIMAIVKAGVDVATTSPEQCYTAANIHQTGTWIPLQVAQCLAYDESIKKGERLSDAWEAKRGTVGTVKLTKKGPAWLRITADRKGWVVIEEKAALVRKMFELAAGGCGVAAIAGVLYKECPEGLTGRGWQPSYIRSILRSRSVVGEYQPHVGTCAKRGRKSTRKKAGDPVQGYFPAVITEAEFLRVKTALDGRQRGGGRTQGTPNIFNGVLYDALDGQRVTAASANRRRVLVSSGAMRKRPGSQFRSIRYDIFEREVLARLAELKPADVLGRPGAAEERVAELTEKLTALNRKMESVKARAAEEEDVTVFFDLLADLDRRRKDLAAALEQAKALAAGQEGDNVGEFRSLVGLLEAADAATPEEGDALRRRVRAALRRVVKEMWVLIVPRGHYRLVAVQAWFHEGGRHRDYLLCYRPPRRDASGEHEEETRVLSSADVKALGPLDLRRPDHVRQLEEVLAAMELPR